MTLIEEVLRRHGYSLSEAAFVEHLDALLSEPRLDVAFIDLSTTDAAFLAEYSGVAPASEADLARLDAQSAARAAAEAARTLSRGKCCWIAGRGPIQSVPSGRGRQAL